MNTTSGNPRNDDQQARATVTLRLSNNNLNASGGSGQTGIPTNSNIPSHISPSKDILPRNILAFRTISTFLGLIQQERPFKVSDSTTDLSQIDRRELKISNAVATLAVADNDITAVITKRWADTLEVITSTGPTPHSDDDSEKPCIESKSNNIFSRVWELMVNKNYRRDDPKPPVCDRDPTIINATIPNGLEPDDDEGLKDYLDKCW